MSKPVSAPCIDGIPLPIIRLNRIVLVAGVALGLITQQPWIIVALFLIILPAALFGRRASVIYKVGSRLFAKQILTAEKEDFRVQRFNNAIAAFLLGASVVAFVLGAPVVGWVLAIAVAAAALVALLGFCVGCFIYYQFNLHKRRLFAAIKP